MRCVIHVLTFPTFLACLCRLFSRSLSASTLQEMEAAVAAVTAGNTSDGSSAGIGREICNNTGDNSSSPSTPCIQPHLQHLRLRIVDSSGSCGTSTASVTSAAASSSLASSSQDGGGRLSPWGSCSSAVRSSAGGSSSVGATEDCKAGAHREPADKQSTPRAASMLREPSPETAKAAALAVVLQGSRVQPRVRVSPFQLAANVDPSLFQN